MSGLTNVWFIRRADTKEILGIRDRFNAATASFGERAPLIWISEASCREGWMKHCVDEKYLIRAVTVAGRGVRYTPGENYCQMPPVELISAELRHNAQQLMTHEMMRIYDD